MQRIGFIGAVLALTLAACQPAPVETAPAAIGETEVVEATSVTTAEAANDTASEPTAETRVMTYVLAAGEATLSYSVGETFINQNNKFSTAVGTTSSVSGVITVDTTTPKNSSIGKIAAEIFEFKSDSSKRDSVIRDRFLESRLYPTVTFVPAEISGLPESYTPGETIRFQVTGAATVHGTTLPLTFDVTARLDDGALKGQATTSFLMSEFGFGPISIAGILQTEDEVLVTLDFVAYP